MAKAKTKTAPVVKTEEKVVGTIESCTEDTCTCRGKTNKTTEDIFGSV